jgi:hypothetical protein
MLCVPVMSFQITNFYENCYEWHVRYLHGLGPDPRAGFGPGTTDVLVRAGFGPGTTGNVVVRAGLGAGTTYNVVVRAWYHR